MWPPGFETRPAQRTRDVINGFPKGGGRGGRLVRQLVSRGSPPAATLGRGACALAPGLDYDVIVLFLRPAWRHGEPACLEETLTVQWFGEVVWRWFGKMADS